MEKLDLEFGKLNLEGKAPVENKLVELDKEGTNRDTERLLALLPPELWEEVLDKVTDKFEASNAALLFRQILAPKRGEFLFPQVWGILAPRINDLVMRRVCKTWCSEHDSYYQTENYAKETNFPFLQGQPTVRRDVDDDPSWA